MSAGKSSTATATTATADTTGSRGPSDRGYTGRFAPSPSGELHLGSLYTAVASYLDARAHGGRWLVRLEDLDTPRVVPRSAKLILDTLERFGLEWDGPVVRQSERVEHYVAAIEDLRGRGLTFECSCSRSQLADEDRYPGYCRDIALRPGTATATRLRIEPGMLLMNDRIHGRFRQDVAAAVGDCVIRRRDGVIAYVLAVVLDDAAQEITHVVRGADLLDDTPRQIYLQQLLGFPRPRYAHVPVLTEPDGRKLAKSARSMSVASEPVLTQLLKIFQLLHLPPQRELDGAQLRDVWRWAVANWNIARVPSRLSLPLTQ